MDITEGSIGKKPAMKKMNIILVWMLVKDRYGESQLILLTNGKTGEYTGIQFSA